MVNNTKIVDLDHIEALLRMNEASVNLIKCIGTRTGPRKVKLDKFDRNRVVDDLAVAITKLGQGAVPRALETLHEDHPRQPQTSVLVGNDGTTITLSTADLRSFVRVVRNPLSDGPDRNRMLVLAEWINDNVLTNAQG